ncbi:MAG: hypothetical protein ACYDEH_11905 [Acidimicrobiales bacterium]
MKKSMPSHDQNIVTVGRRAHSRTRRTSEQIHWGQLASVVLVGVAVAAFGVFTNIGLHWTDIWPVVFLTVGSTFSLGGVLFVLQRSWVSEVTEEVQQAGEEARSAVRVVEERAAEIEEELQARRPISVEELRDLVVANRASTTESRRDAIEVLRKDLSFSNLSAVLSLAQNLNAIGPGFRARATFAPAGLRLAIRLVDHDDRGFEVDAPHIELWVIPLDIDANEIKPTYWTSTESIDEVIGKLMLSCQRANLPSTPPDFDPAEGFRQLVESLDMALSVRQGASGTPLRGDLIEMIDESWSLTTVGLENRFLKIVVPLADFVDYIYYAADIRGTLTIRKKDPAPPEHVDQATWDYLKTVVWADPPDSPPDGSQGILD